MELVLVHITDIHLKNENDYSILETRVEYIVKAINKHIIDETNTLLVLAITGDIAYSGAEDQYLYASIFISDIISGIKNRYKKLNIQIVTVPGNHDCDFYREDSELRESLINNPNLNMLNSSIIKTCTSAEEKYFNFVKGNQLYSSERPDQSGFSVLKIDLESNIERFFSYEWNGRLYENILDTQAREFTRNRFIKNEIELKVDFREYLDDNEIDLISKAKGLLKLSDIFVYPVLKGESIHNRKNKILYKNKKDIIQVIENKKYIMISGEKEYGKTALLKQRGARI